MMTQKNLQAFYQRRVKLNELILTLDGLRKIHAEPPDNQTLEMVTDGIQDLEAEIRQASQDIKAREEDVAATLSLLDDVFVRVTARLHYLHGLEWKEVAAFMNEKSANAVRARMYRAMKNVIPAE